jgi:uncharacterized protein YndB with AHSA1/START domain
MAVRDNEIQITRVYNTPAKLVWEAFTDLEHVAKWWGPRGFTITTKSKDFKVGGKWIYTMHGPDGTDYPNTTTYHEIVKHERIVYDHGGNEERPKLFTVTALFTEKRGPGGKPQTTLSLAFALPTAEEAQQMEKFIRQANGYSTWDRLGEYLEEQSTGKDVFEISRSFAADVATLYRMWTDPAHFARWLPPTGATMEFVKADIREGGSARWAMHMHGQVSYGQVDYLTLRAPSLLVYTQMFCDRDGKPGKPAFAPTYPDKILTTVTFADEGLNQSRVTVRWEILGEATAAERRTFHEMKAGMTMGWGGSFDKLEALLTTAR